jgi:hypothetical protein
MKTERQKLTLVAIASLFVGLVAYRVWRSADLPASRRAIEMPASMREDEERALYMSPGGKYTLVDIEANGGSVASRKYRGFQASHDYEPMPGDTLCPVTRTKANPSCTWTVDGKVYQFCCPPCVDEFVRLAKQHPDRIRAPEYYVK